MRLGVPRGLFYYHHYPLLRTFFAELGVEIVVSPTTTREMLAVGCSHLAAETCLPVKVFCGHVASLAGKCDQVLVPSIQSLEPKVHNCPKFIGLPDVIRAALPQCPPLLDPDIDVNGGSQKLHHSIYRLGRPFTWNPLKVKRAAQAAERVHEEYLQQKVRLGLSAPQAIDRLFTSEEPPAPQEDPQPSMTIALIGHPYILYDEYVNHRLASRLRKMGARVLFPDTVAPGELRASLCQAVERPYWTCEDEIVGAGAYYLQSPVDGLISVSPFGCGPDSMMLELVEGYAKRAGKPYMKLILDEHTAQVGLVTRLEAFVDTILSRRKLSVRPASPPPSKTPDVTPQGIKALGIPNMGDKFISFRSMAQELGVKLIVPPVTKETLTLGARYSPESACLPYKAILGNFIQALEQGADTLFMVTSFNACRMGYYSKVQEQTLRDLGYRFQFLRFHSSDKGLPGVLRAIKRWSNGASWPKVIALFRLGVAKLSALDDLEREVQKVRPVEITKGTADRIYRNAIEAMNAAASLDSVKQVTRDYMVSLRQIPQKPRANPLRVAIVGELYVVMVPFVNFDLEAELGKMGVEVHRSRSTYFSEYTKFLGFMNTLNDEKKHLREFAAPYMRRDVGGHGLESVGERVHLSGKFDGVIHLAPFTCMPEIVAQNIMPAIREGAPLLTLHCDEQMAKTGVVTRLEAFVDLMERRRKETLRVDRLSPSREKGERLMKGIL